METELQTAASPLEKINVLLIGNNPIELSRVFDALSEIKGKSVMTEIAFDLESILHRLARFRPEYILIDDNIGKLEMKSAVGALLSLRKTKDIPITVLKNSNYREALSTGFLNYILKENISAETLYRELVNSLKLRKTQLYLNSAYNKRKGQLMRMMSF